MIRYFCFVSSPPPRSVAITADVPSLSHRIPALHSLLSNFCHINVSHLLTSIFGYMCFSVLFYLFLYLFCLITNVIVAVGDDGNGGMALRLAMGRFDMDTYVYVFGTRMEKKVEEKTIAMLPHIIDTLLLLLLSHEAVIVSQSQYRVNGGYWFGIFLNAKNCHGVIATIKKQEKMSNQIPYDSLVLSTHTHTYAPSGSPEIERHACLLCRKSVCQSESMLKINFKWCVSSSPFRSQLDRQI